MTLGAGTRLGPYEIISPLGAGAMGEVYRGRDKRLGRDAAIKVLPAAFASDAESLRRFEHEARAASALNHPNIVTVYDVGSAESVSYIAMELVEGRNLRDVMNDGRLPIRRILEIGAQIAEGLAAAHARGLVHRDLKPQNVMLTRDGLVKILDFGLAKQVGTESLGADEAGVTAERSLTTPGTILGTVGYMSPEQARGEPADARSDQFSLGVILYEMASGRRAFDRGSAIETLSAILRDEPSPLEAADPSLPGPFCWIVERCLAKEPDRRYESTRDLAWDLKGLREHLSRSSLAGATGIAGRAGAEPRPSGLRRAAVPALILAAVAAGALAATLWRRPAPPPVFQQLTFRRGTVLGARFAPDGRSVVYAAAWEGGPFRVFRKAPEASDSRELDLPDANLLSISRSGELALSVGYRLVEPVRALGMLAQAPAEGGAPRDLARDVLFADWAPNGKDLAVVRDADGKRVLEYPIGKRVFETNGSISYPRVSPKGDLVAFLDHPSPDDNRGTVAVVDAAGRKRTLTSSWAAEEGLAWHPSGKEIWFGATIERSSRAIQAVDLSGSTRVVARAPGKLTLHDIAPDGRALVTRESWQIGIFARGSGDAAERDVSSLDESLLTDLSADGSRLLFTQLGGTVDRTYAIYLRRRNEKSPMRVGEGFVGTLSPDGRFVLSVLPTEPPELHLLPTGEGQPRRIVPKGLALFEWANWLPDGKRILVAGGEPGGKTRLYVCDIETGSTRAITSESVLLPGLSGGADLARRAFRGGPAPRRPPGGLPARREPGAAHSGPLGRPRSDRLDSERALAPRLPPRGIADRRAPRGRRDGADGAVAEARALRPGRSPGLPVGSRDARRNRLRLLVPSHPLGALLGRGSPLGRAANSLARNALYDHRPGANIAAIRAGFWMP